MRELGAVSGQPAQQRDTRPSRWTVKLIRPAWYSKVITAPGGNDRTVAQPLARARLSASLATRPT